MSDYSWEIKYKAEGLRAQRKELRRLELVLAADVPGSESTLALLREAQEALEIVEQALAGAAERLPETEVKA
jgi:hypothetical protein